MVIGDENRSPGNQKNPVTEGNGHNLDTLFSPRFKTAAALAGWDEEALLLASLIVEDTPDRDCKSKNRSVLKSKTPPTNSRRAQRSPESIPVAVLDLDEEETPRKDSGKKKKEKKTSGDEGTQGSKVEEKSSLPFMDKLREELSCAICLEICFEPSSTPCGHSFCRKCLRSAADKCGKRCPKCRQLISNGRSCTVNTVLWNTIQLLFPQEVEARKAASGLNSRQATQCLSPETAFYSNLRNQNTQASGASTRGMSSRRSGVTNQNDDRVQNNSRNQTLSSSSARVRTRRGIPTQDEDAALAQRLQREEFMHAFRGSQEEQSSRPSLNSARANLRAMATRAMNVRVRDRRI